MGQHQVNVMPATGDVPALTTQGAMHAGDRSAHNRLACTVNTVHTYCHFCHQSGGCCSLCDDHCRRFGLCYSHGISAQ